MSRTFSRTLVWLSAVVLIAGGCRPNAAQQVTFNRDVAPIVFAKCASCHHPGEAAPFSLLSYDDARQRAQQIVEVTQTRFMPPWLPEENHGEFLGERRLTDEELATLAAWVEQGALEGDPADLPAAPEFTPGWQLGAPDEVLETPAYELASTGADDFRNFVLSVEDDKPRWIRAIELRPENPRVTHHARLGIDGSNESVRRDAADNAPGYPGMAWGQDPDGQLVTWTPGMQADEGMPGVAWPLRPGQALVLHTHMQPSGKRETVKFRVGLHFAEEPPRERPVVLRIGSRNIDIPPGVKDHRVTDEYVLPIDVDVQFVFPHAHSLCREIKAVAVLPDGSEQPLVWIRNFDENWHDKYRFKAPLRLPAGTRLVSTFTYDNSADNLRNPHNPPQRVVYGSNADDEMSDVYLQVTPVDPQRRAVLTEDYNAHELDAKIVGYLKTLELYPEDPWSRDGLASCYVAKKQPAEAIAVLNEHLEATISSPPSLVILAMAHFANGERVSAVERLRQALEQDPQYSLAWLGLGQVLAAGDEAVEAEQALRRALELSPSMTMAYLDLADLLVTQDRAEEAAAACEQAIAAAPGEVKPHLKLAEIRAAQGRFDESLAQFERAREIAPYTYAPKISLAVLRYQSGEEEAPRAMLAEVAEESPDDPVVHLYLGQIARRDEKRDDAKAELAKAASLATPNTWPESHRRQFLRLMHLERFQLAQELEDLDLARAAVAAWLEVEPGNEQLRELSDQLKEQAEP